MNKLTQFINRFPYNHPNFGISNLMKYVVLSNVLVFLLYTFSDYGAVSFLAFNWDAILSGEVWRLFTYVLMPSSYSALSFAITAYLYYFIGNILEREWGTGRFTLYFVSGVVLTTIGAVLSCIIAGDSITFSGTSYLYTSMFMAFAMLYPDNQVLLMFIIPIKMKYLAVAGAALFAWNMVSGLITGNWFYVIVPLFALLNFVAFFFEQISSAFGYYQKRSQHQHSAQTIHFKTAAKKQAQQQKKQGYRHKCEVCGRTDTDYPTLQFRYCSRCSGYHCYCEEHIANHDHHTD
ncbi:rhomboid family intramembrane serine protease [Bengtsoniella intestinalis]|uniref:rhomboid family intramembrane serine protease n=1 Tax=Bengtsoniella intestinalis TaxID=3073143 RepID=UPI00391FC3BA